jgi:nicotinate-nucleotide pyrophosphorylase (carboxylating)
MINEFITESVIKRALEEDISYGDITTDSIVNEFASSEAKLIAKQEGIIAGIEICEKVFKMLDASSFFMNNIKDGDFVKSGDVIAIVKGRTGALLKAERTALNILQRLSGIATKTRSFCDSVKDYNVRIVDTRKTTPGLRLFEKYAVKVGGGDNHRYSLSDGVLIKDNHIKAAGGIKEAITLAKKNVPHTIKIEVETETMEQVKEALEAGADIIMLDNMTVEQMKNAVKFINKRALIEASGNMKLELINEVASTGVDIISVGALTHSASSLDISMRIY